MIGWRYVRGYGVWKKGEYKDVIVRGGECVCSGLGGVGGVMECWDGERGWEGEGGWECGVMIDNMMKVEVLLEGSGVCGDCRL